MSSNNKTHGRQPVSMKHKWKLTDTSNKYKDSHNFWKAYTCTNCDSRSIVFGDGREYFSYEHETFKWYPEDARMSCGEVIMKAVLK